VNYLTKGDVDKALFKNPRLFNIAYYLHKKMARLHPLMSKLDEKFTTIDSKIIGRVIVGKRLGSWTSVWINRGKTL